MRTPPLKRGEHQHPFPGPVCAVPCVRVSSIHGTPSVCQRGAVPCVDRCCASPSLSHVDRLRTPYRTRASPVAGRCLSAARPKSETPFRRDLFRSAVGPLCTVASIHITGGAAMRSKTTTTKKQTASVQSQGDSVDQVTRIGRLVAPRSCGRPHPASTSRPSGSPRTARATLSSTTWSSGVSSPTSPASSSARVALSISRVGSRAASGRPPTAVHN